MSSSRVGPITRSNSNNSNSSVDSERAVLIVNCLKNDDDHEIAHMSNMIQKVMRAASQKYEVVDFIDIKSLKNNYNEVVFVSHHRFYDEELLPIPLLKRSVGGYSLNDCAQAVCKLAQENKVANFQFYGCEMACNIDTETYPENDNEEVFQYPFRRQLYYAANNSRDDSKISSLHYIGSAVYKKLSEEKDGRSISIRGLNGVGFIKEEHGAKPLAFNQKHFRELKMIEQKERQILKETDGKGKKKMQQVARKSEQAFFENRVQNKESPHQIEFVITVDF